MYRKARQLIEKATHGEVMLVVHPLVLAETAYTLQSYYNHPRKCVATTLKEFVRLSGSGISVKEKATTIDALERVFSTGVHFVDAFLASISAGTGCPVATFDGDFRKFSDAQTYPWPN